MSPIRSVLASFMAAPSIPTLDSITSITPLTVEALYTSHVDHVCLSIILARLNVAGIDGGEPCEAGGCELPKSASCLAAFQPRRLHLQSP
jgi:hypothetical protein